ncbi:MAG: glycosyltransferase family 4 protein [Geobacter sp.]|nr:glycosyltransferase family 4 protein [Geobacter sp.]
MKILHAVEFYHPSVGGMQEVVKQLSERMAAMGHDVTVATTRLPERGDAVLNGVRIAEFDISGNLARGMAGEVDSFREFVLSGGYDVVTCFAAQQWATDALLPVLDRIRAAKVFVPTGFSGLYDPLYKEYFASMGNWLKQFDMNVFLSEDYRDINFARSCGVDKMTVIPNGAAEDEFLPDAGVDARQLMKIPRDHLLILHVGSHTGIKGHAEAIRIFARAAIKNATFLMIANDFGGCTRGCRMKETLFNAWPKRLLDGKRLLVASLPRRKTVAAYKAADLFLFPSNIECSPLVLFESMASGTPFLSTDVGNAAEIVRWSGGGEILPTSTDANGYARADLEGSARMLADLCRDAVRRKSLGEAGYAAWRERFTWEKIAREYEGLYYRVVRDKACN